MKEETVEQKLVNARNKVIQELLDWLDWIESTHF